MPFLGFAIGIFQITCAFLCVREAERKGRLNNWWVLAAAMFGVLAYLVVLWLPSRSAESKNT
ncbi:MAG: hypothetical protein ACXACY_19755 [Candidatus Hodarchaeales archaeon]|jgi:hypothetical protein